LTSSAAHEGIRLRPIHCAAERINKRKCHPTIVLSYLLATLPAAKALAENPTELHVVGNQLWLWMVASAGAIIAGLRWYFDSRKEDAKSLSDRIKKLESDSMNHTIQHTQHQQEREKLADKVYGQLGHLEKKVSETDQILTKVVGLESDIKHQNQRFAEMKLEINNSINKLEASMERHNERIIELLKNPPHNKP
jgi:hypothetical protein